MSDSDLVESGFEGLPGMVLDILRESIGDAPRSLHEPIFVGNEKDYMTQVIDSTFVSYSGKFVDRFEAELREIVGVKHAIAIVNGTAALQLSLKVLGVEANDEVLVPAMTFVATANAVSHLGGIPHFVDTEAVTLGIDPEALVDWLRFVSERASGQLRNKLTGRRIKAIVPVNIFGHPCNLSRLVNVADEYGIAVVEDASESLGSYFGDRHTGTIGDIGVFSFNGNKIITTGGGGAIVTNNDQVARRARHLSTTAKVNVPWRFIHDEVGYNFRMPNINAALGCAQLEELSRFIESKRRLFRVYADAFSKLQGVSVMREPLGCVSNYWLQTLVLDDHLTPFRDAIIEETNKAGYGTRPVWELLNTLDPYAKCPKAPLEVSVKVSRKLINLPSSVGLA